MNDFLWMGGAEEGVAIASAILHYRQPVPGKSLDSEFLILKGKKSLSRQFPASDREGDGATASSQHQGSAAHQTPHPTPTQIQKVMAHHRSGIDWLGYLQHDVRCFFSRALSFESKIILNGVQCELSYRMILMISLKKRHWSKICYTLRLRRSLPLMI